MHKNNLEELYQKIYADSAKFVHDIGTPLITIGLHADLIANHLPALLTAYLRFGDSDTQSPRIKQRELEALTSAAAAIKDAANLVRSQSRDYWQAIDNRTNQTVPHPVNTHLSEKNPRQARRLRILLAEDEKIHQKIALKLLSPRHEVELVDNGAQAAERGKASIFDLILMDLHMPKADGYTASRDILQSCAQCPPIIALTNRPIDGEQSFLQQYGFSAVMDKPLNLQRLDALLQELGLNT